jgi:ABC-type multidrug transport system fused ATPase/permease subunit
MTWDAWAFGLFTLIVGCVVTFVAAHLYFKAAQTWKELSWHLHRARVTAVASEYTNKIQMILSGSPVRELYQFEIHVWNSGNSTIDRQAVAPLQPISLSIKNGIVIDYSLSRVVNAANNISLSLQDSELGIDFDYLDPDEGFVVSALIDATGEARCSATVSGTIKERGKISQPDVISSAEGTTIFKKSIHVLTAMILIVCAVALFYSFVTNISLTVRSASDFLSAILVTVVALITCFTMFPLWPSPSARRLPKSLEPINLSDYSFVGYPRSLYASELGDVTYAGEPLAGQPTEKAE